MKAESRPGIHGELLRFSAPEVRVEREPLRIDLLHEHETCGRATLRVGGGKHAPRAIPPLSFRHGIRLQFMEARDGILVHPRDIAPQGWQGKVQPTNPERTRIVVVTWLRCGHPW